MRDPNRELSEGRKLTYYIGMGLVVVGFIVFLSIFFSAARNFGDFNNFAARSESMALRAVAGIVLVIIGAVLSNVGSRGLAGSGVLLDPKRTRDDLEPWARAAGGLVKDAVDESGLPVGKPAPEAELPFDEKLRRLDQLRKDGLLTEQEYQEKRQQILQSRW